MPTLNFEVLHLDCPIESTYMYLFDWALEHPDERANYVLDVAHQTAGRGQQGNSWYASEGLNLLPSFLVRFPRLFAPMVWALSELTALAVWHTVSSFLEDPTELRIKWPNDIYYKNRKLAGILIGHSLASKRVDFSVIGIGLNVNEANFPPNTPQPHISFADQWYPSRPSRGAKGSLRLYGALPRGGGDALSNDQFISLGISRQALSTRLPFDL